MHPVENKILNDLLDKYENSKLSRGENQRAIHIAFPFNKKTMPKYFDESSLEIETIHAAAEQMEREGLVAIAWKNQKPGYIIEKLVLCEDHVEEAYERLGSDIGTFDVAEGQNLRAFANDRIFDDAVGTNADAALKNDSAFKNAIDVNFDVLRADEFAADVDALGINESDARIKKRIGLGALPRTLELRELALRVDAFDFVDVLRV